MCGIAGYYSLSKLFTKDDLVKMTDALAHRGPNAAGVYNDQIVGLGHRRLSILDLSDSANQPMYSRNGRYVIVFNGEVYNYKELAKKWSLSLKTTSDTEVLVEAFARYGIDAVSEFNGMFAFAIYDSKEEVLYLFRDRMGIKPLYYSSSPKGFVFASETKALLEVDKSKEELNFEALKDYFFLEYIPANQSIFKSINKLEPGHFIKISKSGIEIHKYYNLLDHYNPMYGVKEEDLLNRFEENLRKSIGYQSISDVPLGAFLSGGTDSSLICAVFQNQFKNPINTFTIGFDVKKYDESEYARKVAEYLGTKHKSKVVTSKVSIEYIENLPAYYDEPFAAPSVVPSLEVCKNARDIVTVALSGDGGDELFMGYGYYNWHKRVSLINKVGGNFGRKFLSELLSYSSKESTQKASRILGYTNQDNKWSHIWSQDQYMFNEKEISLLFSNDYKHTSTFNSWKKVDNMNVGPFEKISLFDILNYLPANLLYKMDIASMSKGLEVRVPYLDHHLVEFAMNLPQEFKIRNGESKYLMKKLLERYIPKELIYRKKWGFPAPVGNWLQGDLSILIDKYLNKAVLEKQGIFNSEFVIKYIKEFRKGNFIHYKRIWSLLFFQLWYSYYIDKNLSNG